MMDIQKELNSQSCNGCCLCQNLCPKKSISMVYSDDGFLVPRINDNCIRCHICVNNCPQLTHKRAAKNDITLQMMECKSSSDEIVLNSSSGGVFSEIANSILKSGGVVFGATLEKDYTVRHFAVKSDVELSKIRYSKYIQSDLSNTYKEVKDYLERGVPVLFAGTPCQLNALKLFLKKEYEALFLVDLLCFGIMSTSVFKEYIKYALKDQALSDGYEVYFRKKGLNNWPNSFAIYKDGHLAYEEQFHFSKKGIGFIFGSGLAKRHQCETCNFKAIERVSDITLADFRKKDAEPDFNSSLVLVNTQKGKKFFEGILVEKRILGEDECAYVKERVIRKDIPNIYRKSFLKSFSKNGFSKKTLKYIAYKKDSIFVKIKRKILWMIRK